MGKVTTDRLGELNYNQHGTLMKIIRYANSMDIDIEFQDDNKYITKHRRYDDFIKGKVQNPFDKTVFNIGYLGEINIVDAHSKSYHTWKGILERCYDQNFQKYKPTYKDCTICEEWLNYSIFKKWFENHIYYIQGERMDLDKDILHKGNKCYCPQYCIFVPSRINTLFTNGTNVRGKLPVGVTLDRTTYRARLSTLEGRKDLGHYKNIEYAFQAYKIAKEQYIKKVADIYKDKIPLQLYNAMYDYKVEITD